MISFAAFCKNLRLFSPHAGVALPLDWGHFAGSDIHLERAIFANATFLAFKRNPITPWREKDAKPPLSVRRKFRYHGVRLGLYDKCRVGEWSRGRLVRSDRPGVPRANSNHTFDARLRFRRDLHRQKGWRHGNKQQDYSDARKLHR